MTGLGVLLILAGLLGWLAGAGMAHGIGRGLTLGLAAVAVGWGLVLLAVTLGGAW